MSRQTNPHAVFTNSELSLKNTNVYGFDFDCTLVHYTSEVHRLIYELARDRLVEHNDVSIGREIERRRGRERGGGKRERERGRERERLIPYMVDMCTAWSGDISMLW